MSDVKALAQSMVDGVKSYVGRVIAPVNTRLSDLEARIKALELAAQKEPKQP